MALTERQQRFVAAMLVEETQEAAAIAAGYSPKSAEVQASKMLRLPEVAAALAEARAARSIRTNITADRVLEELARIAFSDLRKIASWDRNGIQLKSSTALDDDTAPAIAEVAMTEHGPKVKLYDKPGALRELAKHLGLTPERHEHSGPGGGPIEVSDAHAKLAILVARAAGGQAPRGDGRPEPGGG